MTLYPLGLNLFFQPGLGPGFFLILGSSGAFGLCLLLLGWVTLPALRGGENSAGAEFSAAICSPV